MSVVIGLISGLFVYAAFTYNQVYATRKEIAELHNEIKVLKSQIWFKNGGN